MGPATEAPPEQPLAELGPHLFSTDGVSWVCSACGGALRGFVKRCKQCKVRFDGTSGVTFIDVLFVAVLVVIVVAGGLLPLIGW